MLNHKNYQNALNHIDISHITDEKIYSMADNYHNKSAQNSSNVTSSKNTRHFQTAFKIVAAVAVAILGISCVTVSAYDAYTRYRQINKNAGNTHEYADNAEDKSIDLNVTDNHNNINVTVQDVKADSMNMYITVKIATNNGAALTATSGLNVASLLNNSFETAYLTDGTNRYNITSVTRVDDCSDITAATYELNYNANTNNTATLASLKSSKLSLVLKNLTYPLVCNGDIGFNATDLGSVSTQTNAGSTVTFSSAYSYASIVNITKTDYTAEDGAISKPAIAITYKIDSEATLKAVVNFKLFNKITGASTYPVSTLKPNGDTVERITNYTIDDNGYVTVTYAPRNNDNLHNNLASYILAGDSITTNEVIAGEWSFDIPAGSISTELTYSPNQSFVFNGANININKVILTDSSIAFYGNTVSGNYDSDKYRPDFTITFVMSDGSMIAPGIDSFNSSGTGYDSNTGIFDSSYTFEKLVNSEDIVGFYFNKQYIKLK